MSSLSSEIVILFEVKDSTDIHSEMRLLFLMDGSLLYLGIIVVA